MRTRIKLLQHYSTHFIKLTVCVKIKQARRPINVGTIIEIKLHLKLLVSLAIVMQFLQCYFVCFIGLALQPALQLPKKQKV